MAASELERIAREATAKMWQDAGGPYRRANPHEIWMVALRQAYNAGVGDAETVANEYATDLGRRGDVAEYIATRIAALKLREEGGEG